MACRDCGETRYPDGQRCNDCAGERVRAWKAGELVASRPIEDRMAAEARPMRRRATPDNPDQGALV